MKLIADPSSCFTGDDFSIIVSFLRSRDGHAWGRTPAGQVGNKSLWLATDGQEDQARCLTPAVQQIYVATIRSIKTTYHKRNQ